MFFHLQEKYLVFSMHVIFETQHILLFICLDHFQLLYDFNKVKYKTQVVSRYNDRTSCHRERKRRKSEGSVYKRGTNWKSCTTAVTWLPSVPAQLLKDVRPADPAYFLPLLL